MNERKFSTVLEEYLTERDNQNGDYYRGQSFCDRVVGQRLLETLADELDDMIKGVKG